MTAVPGVVTNVLREAAARRWVHALAIGVTVILAVLAVAADTKIVGGVSSGLRLFGRVVHADVMSADVAMRPFLRGMAYVVFYGCASLMCLATADFAPALLGRGRVEQLLALPVRRWELLLGIYLAVLLLVSVAALYAATGFAVIVGVRTGVWSGGAIFAAALAVVSFAAQYAAMLAAAVLARSAAVSAGVGAVMLMLGIVAGARDRLAGLFDAGAHRAAFVWLMRIPPPTSALGTLAADLASGESRGVGAAAPLAIQFAFVSAALLAVACAAMARQDY